MPLIARELGLSVRSLRRKLEQEGTTYRNLTQSLLFDSARTLLRNPRESLQGIADALGFADASSFHRAFSRWAGRTPLEYRAASTSTSARLTDSHGERARSGAGAV